MVKWVVGIKLESFVVVKAVVKKPLEPVKSCKVSGYELHLSKVYMVATAPEMLGLGMAAASRAASRLDEEEVAEGVEGTFISPLHNHPQKNDL
jgi:aspartyl-tRNA synthetase